MTGVLLLRDRRDVGIRLDVEVEEAFPLLSDADVVRPLPTLGAYNI